MRHIIAATMLVCGSLGAMQSSQDILRKTYTFDKTQLHQQLQKSSAAYIEEKGKLSDKLAGKKDGFGILLAIEEAVYDTKEDLKKGGAPQAAIITMDMYKDNILFDIFDEDTAHELLNARSGSRS